MVVNWAENHFVFLKEDDNEETGRERETTFIEYFLWHELCWMLYLSCFFKFTPGSTLQIRELRFRKIETFL